MKTKFIKYLAFLPLLASCDDLFDPAQENIQDIEYMHNDPSYAQGILGNAYILLPYSSSPSSDLATDDAVTNDNSSYYLKMATGAWASNMNPVSQWDGRYHAIQYVNLFLENVDQVKWANTPVLRTMYNDHFKGEAYGMRALQLFHVLRAHAGLVDGTLYGVPIHTASENASSDFNQPRATFQACIDQIMTDLDSAMYYLPLDCGDISSDDQLPARYKEMRGTMADYNRAFGDHQKGVKLTGRVCEGIRAQVALFAASPAYASGSNVTYTQAADQAAIVLDRIGGIAGMDPNGWHWYSNTDEIDNLKAGQNQKEVLWRSGLSNGHSLESDNYPNSLYGSGRTNPTQNLVDAFPMANGYPIANAASGYNAQDPYADRDPRLKTYILVNGEKQGVNNSEIITGSYGSKVDALNKEQGKSTRTGYYMRKLLRSDINLDPNSTTDKNHVNALIRYTEIFLDYAEAANEAWGPQGKGSHSYSAYDVIKAIRQRAGVGGTDDPYLEANKGDKEAMRQIIRNERRLELCFENHRFWDLRRWNVDLQTLNQSARGMDISQSSTGLSYSVISEVEKRDYKDFMIYGPIPYSEVLKFDALKQNTGWE